MDEPVLVKSEETKSEDKTGTAKPVKSKPTTSVWQDILMLMLKILIIVLLFVLLFTFLFGASRYNDVAMNPNVKAGDLVVYYRLDKKYMATDLVALKYKGKVQIMRVVAVEGDTVDMTAEGLVINGALQSEPDPAKTTLPYTEGVQFPITLKKGEIFVLGDDRENSTDSRVYGAVASKDTLGEVMTVIRRRNF